jgi:hypothetical protein
MMSTWPGIVMHASAYGAPATAKATATKVGGDDDA